MAACMNISRELFTEHGPPIRSCTIALKEVINPSLEPHNCVSPLSERCDLRVLYALHNGQMLRRFSPGTHSYMEGVYECGSLARPRRQHSTVPAPPSGSCIPSAMFVFFEL